LSLPNGTIIHGLPTLPLGGGTGGAGIIPPNGVGVQGNGFGFPGGPGYSGGGGGIIFRIPIP
jgi:hypothetical protein